MKTSYKDIKGIRELTPNALKGKNICTFSGYLEIGYYIPSNANWAYIVAVVNYDGWLTKVVTRFGVIL